MVSQSSNHIIIIISGLTTKFSWLTAVQENKNAFEKTYIFFKCHYYLGSGVC